MNDFAEKRHFHRMGIECLAQFRIQGAADVAEGKVKNLSAAGLLLIAPQEINPGTQLAIHIVPEQAITPPLSATVNVVRSSPADAGNYEIACAIERILTQDEIGDDYP
ncbi:MAG: PilZ domain-containing protein [Candidatus Thiodiazotropha sp. (ex Notomyrtea botanica)]|nr:PilZ domain-containing protein [Candidatus Thiodiazotropha sp. (ex Notomyrtea botanica)]MCU7850725.1 PilZ domain-containing protein [Candidatus Thiodiazotropha sp. (ex Monitilora ramsayi)]